MDKELIKSTIIEIAIDIFDITEEKIDYNAYFSDNEKYSIDSLDFFEFLSKIEEKFDVNLENIDSNKILSINKLADEISILKENINENTN